MEYRPDLINNQIYSEGNIQVSPSEVQRLTQLRRILSNNREFSVFLNKKFNKINSHVSRKCFVVP